MPAPLAATTPAKPPHYSVTTDNRRADRPAIFALRMEYLAVNQICCHGINGQGARPCSSMLVPSPHDRSHPLMAWHVRYGKDKPWSHVCRVRPPLSPWPWSLLFSEAFFLGQGGLSHNENARSCFSVICPRFSVDRFSSPWILNSHARVSLQQYRDEEADTCKEEDDHGRSSKSQHYARILALALVPLMPPAPALVLIFFGPPYHAVPAQHPPSRIAAMLATSRVQEPEPEPAGWSWSNDGEGLSGCCWVTVTVCSRQ